MAHHCIFNADSLEHPGEGLVYSVVEWHGSSLLHRFIKEADHESTWIPCQQLKE